MIRVIFAALLAGLLAGCARSSLSPEERMSLISAGTAMMAGPRYEYVDPPQILQPPPPGNSGDTICRPMGGGSYRCN